MTWSILAALYLPLGPWIELGGMSLPVGLLLALACAFFVWRLWRSTKTHEVDSFVFWIHAAISIAFIALFGYFGYNTLAPMVGRIFPN